MVQLDCRGEVPLDLRVARVIQVQTSQSADLAPDVRSQVVRRVLSPLNPGLEEGVLAVLARVVPLPHGSSRVQLLYVELLCYRS